MITCENVLSGNRFISLCLAGLLASLAVWHIADAEAAAVRAGWIEEAVIMDLDGKPAHLVVHAKLDTGAETSSLHADELVLFERDGVDWAAFTVSNRDNETVRIEEPVIRVAKIKRHYGKSQERPVIMLEVCIGDVKKRVEVNLVNRSGLKYRLLIGRNYLAGDLVVDSGRTYSLAIDCGIAAERD